MTSGVFWCKINFERCVIEVNNPAASADVCLKPSGAWPAGMKGQCNA